MTDLPPVETETYPPTHVHGPVPPSLPPPAFGRREGPDPGSPRWAVVAWIAAVVLVSVTVLMNQADAIRGGGPKPETTAIAPPGLDANTINCKVFVKISKAWTLSESERDMAVGQLDGTAKSPAEVFRTAITAGEITGADDALERLDRSESMNDESEQPSEELAADIAAARSAYASDDAVLTEEQKAGLRERHGWFGELLVARGLPETDPARQALVGGGMRLLVGLFAFAAVLVLAVLGGIASLVTMLVLMFTGKITRAFVAPAPGGSVYLEMLPVFVAAFVLIHLLADLAATSFGDQTPEWFLPARLGVQWMLLALTLYPLLRGVSWKQHCAAMGWHRGRGFWTEVGAGIFGYLAGLPLMGIVMGLTMVLMVIKSASTGMEWPMRIVIATGAALLAGLVAGAASLLSGRQTVRAASTRALGFGAFVASCVALAVLVLFNGDTGQPSNPIVDLVEGASGWVLFLFAGMAVVWAPLAEESFFRGAFFRHLRSRAGLILSAVVSALVFGVMHGYEFVLLGGVVSLGFTFALLREWRGSLIAPMTAHALHNGTLMCLLIVVLKPLLD